MNELHPSCESGVCDIVKELQATSTIRSKKKMTWI